MSSSVFLSFLGFCRPLLGWPGGHITDSVTRRLLEVGL